MIQTVESIVDYPRTRMETDLPVLEASESTLVVTNCDEFAFMVEAFDAMSTPVIDSRRILETKPPTKAALLLHYPEVTTH
ncbi:hypothetical protein [Natronosalvus amylolyticus]|uniref:hypothetical protein n=1 Tax=Natronosalvus amylolyticus TaxID=2961994 RepID=UPI0020C9A9A3|nr:hypothetical protein [Natronosalvus amylolyticus]